MSTWQPDDRYLSLLRLGKGGHDPADLTQDPEYTACLLEAVSFVAGEPWSDRPECVAPVLGAFGRGLNDILPGGKRQQLKPLIPLLIGTAGDGQDEARSFLALDWLIRVFTPAFLRLVPDLVADADRLTGLPPIVDLPTAEAAGTVVRGARTRAWTAAGAAAGDAARAAAWDAAWDATGAAAEAAAWDAAWDAAEAAARTAARTAAREHLQPTVDALQDSAITLFTRMTNPGVS